MIIYFICYVAGFLFARFGYDRISGLLLILAAGYLYYSDYRKSDNLIHLRGLFSAFWVGGQGIACLKLSKLQTDWSYQTWVCFFLAFLGFWMTFEILQRRHGRSDLFGVRNRRYGLAVRPVYQCLVALTLVSLAAFIIEAISLGYVPLLVKGVPHAYSEFHIRGLHYFTVSCVLVPGLAVLYFLLGGSRNRRRNALVIGMAVLSILIPIFCVSRFQLVFALLLALFTYAAYQKRIEPLHLIGMVIVLIPLYLLLTVARSHDVAYLNGIFEMKNSNIPIFITQPYMYIANNYENFNCLVEALPTHTFGIRMLFPLWALTGLKFLFPYLVSFPLYVNKAELTTVTMFYDAYYDFGMIGVLLFSCILGAVAFYLVDKLGKMRNPIGYLCYGQIAIYFVLSFFTTWFSNPTTWFYLILTGLIALYCAWNSH
ncbi:MAG: O-antigen polymerase [Hungatella sp.]